MLLFFKKEGLALPAAITDAEFQDHLEQCAPLGTRIAIAVSGGADSLCLAWLARHRDATALIVDHGLRSESAAEAALTAERLAAFGIESRVLRLAGLQRGPGLAARARAARYEALAEGCAALGVTDLLLGHHAMDQAETVLMRQEAASGAWGLAGMAPVTHRAGLRLLRPLLGVLPERLKVTLRAAGIGWAEDPSNEDQAALRTRLRARLAADCGLATRLLAEAAHAARARREAAQRIAAVLARRASLFPEGYVLLTPGPIAPDCLGALLTMLGGLTYGPDSAALARCSATLAPATLGGVRLMPAGRLNDGAILLVREPAAMGPAVPAVDGAVWDGRFVLSAAASLPEGWRIAALGGQAPRFRHLTALPSAVLRTLPALWSGEAVCAVPHLGYLAEGDAFTGWTKSGARLTLCPAHTVTGAF